MISYTFSFLTINLINSLVLHYHIFNQCSAHIETNQLICISNQLTGFYVSRTLVCIGLRIKFNLGGEVGFNEYILKRIAIC